MAGADLGLQFAKPGAAHHPVLAIRHMNIEEFINLDLDIPMFETFET